MYGWARGAGCSLIQPMVTEPLCSRESVIRHIDWPGKYTTARPCRRACACVIRATPLLAFDSTIFGPAVTERTRKTSYGRGVVAAGLTFKWISSVETLVNCALKVAELVHCVLWPTTKGTLICESRFMPPCGMTISSTTQLAVSPRPSAGF